MSLTKFPNGVATDVDGYLYGAIADLAAAASSFSVALPYDVEIVSAVVTQEIVVDVDTDVTFEIGGTPITSLLATLTAAGAAGDAFIAADPTGAATLLAGTAVEIVNDGAGAVSGLGRVAIGFKRI